MTERAQVLSRTGSTVLVRCDTGESCESCSSLLCNPRSRTYEAVLAAEPAGEPLHAVTAGDWVEVEVPESGALGKGLVLFVLPIGLFAAVYLLLAGRVSEVVQVASGFVGLATGFGLAVALSRLWREPEARVVRVYRGTTVGPARLPVGESPGQGQPENGSGS